MIVNTPYLIDSLGNNAILKKRFSRIDNVVDNDPATGGCQVYDTLRKSGFPIESRIEGNSRPWGYVMDNFGHSPPFVGSSGPKLQKYLHTGSRQVTRCNSSGFALQLVIRVRKNAYIHAGTRYAVSCPGYVCF